MFQLKLIINNNHLKYKLIFMLRYLGIRSKFRLYFNYDEDLSEIEAYMSYKNELKLVLS